jgi:hypothetical protein
VNPRKLPETIAHISITQQSWQQGKLEGEVRTEHYCWRFEWYFQGGKLSVQPSLGRALIFEPLGRFLELYDYQLEVGGDYQLTIRAKF